METSQETWPPLAALERKKRQERSPEDETWNGGQFVMIVAEKGVVSCGVVDKEVKELFEAALANTGTTPEKASALSSLPLSVMDSCI